jgi:hypothetical protein
MDPATDRYLSRPELIEGLRGGGALEPGCWEPGWAVELLDHASQERLSTEALAALATARRCLDQTAQALRELQHAQAALAEALEAQL